MDFTPDHIWADLRTLRETTPLVLSLTNSVVREFTANALLALGASPIMSDAFEEIAELTGISSALNLNIGTPTPRSAEAMVLAAGVAKAKSIPIALDPVAIGATRLRRELVERLLRIAIPQVIRGNQAEIAALAGLPSIARGVDAVGNLDQASVVVRQLAKQLRTVVVASGATDYLSDGETVIAIENGHPLMARTTGSGCVATAVIASFLPISSSPLAAGISAMVVMDLAGELAADHSRTEGPGSFRVRFLDAFDKLDPEHIEQRMRVAKIW
jgi:hydroxyethylthiazole kinase